MPPGGAGGGVGFPVDPVTGLPPCTECPMLLFIGGTGGGSAYDGRGDTGGDDPPTADDEEYWGGAYGGVLG